MSASDEMDIDAPDLRGVKRTAAEAGLPVTKPPKIQALAPDVVNKIAAGEIIVAPMHALKELVENSVDAGSTSLEILVKDGGLRLLQITDNGHGINRDDLPILCERFTTSKLRSFDDLSSIGTYGFRGEALASVSHIAHLTVTTKTPGSNCAWRAHYSDGKLVPAKPGQSPEPKPTAGRGGTQITVEDLFYNVPSRRRAFRSPSEEYAKILDVVGRYAVHCSGVSFSCKKHGDAGVSISTSANATTVDRIRQIHGTAVANELVDFEISEEKWGFQASGWATSANYHAKRTSFLLFINHRAVESSTIRRAMEQTYSAFLPKGGHPFVYLDLTIDPQRVDVNVHPTKRQVNFLHEDDIIECICAAIRSRLAKVDSSRTFMTQTLLPGVGASEPWGRDRGMLSTVDMRMESQGTPLSGKRPSENNLVRTDVKMRKITSMLQPAPQAASEDDGTTGMSHMDNGLRYENSGREPVQIRLTSIKNLRASVNSSMHNNITEILASLTYVGLVDEQRRIAAIQSGVKLFLVDYGMMCNEFFYQIGLTDFGNFGVIKLESSPKLEDLLSLAAAVEREEHQQRTSGEQTRASSNNGNRSGETEAVDWDDVVSSITRTLISRRDMLEEYFSLSISEDGSLLSIPLLLKGYVPSLAKLPRFLLRLGPYVDWSDEESCFRTFLRELAAFYTPEQLPLEIQQSSAKQKLQKGTGSSSSSSKNNNTHTGDVDSAHDSGQLTGSDSEVSKSQGGQKDEDERKEDETIARRRSQLSRMLEHVIFPTMRSRMLATEDLVRGIIEVADLKGLYRVFERC